MIKNPTTHLAIKKVHNYLQKLFQSIRPRKYSKWYGLFEIDSIYFDLQKKNPITHLAIDKSSLSFTKIIQVNQAKELLKMGGTLFNRFYLFCFDDKEPNNSFSYRQKLIVILKNHLSQLGQRSTQNGMESLKQIIFILL